MRALIRSCFGLLAIGGALCAAATTFRASAATVYINEYPVFSLKSKLDGFTPEVRADRIVATLSASGIQNPLSIRATPKGIWVQSGAVPVVRVTELEAKAQGVDSKSLAIQWKNRVEFALQLPAVQAANNYALVPIGQSQLVRLVGFEAQLAEFEIKNSQIVKAERVTGGVQLSGLSAGEAEVIIRTPSGRTRIVTKVQPSALMTNVPLSAEVMGTPSTPAQVETAVLAAVRQQLKAASEATIEVLEVPPTTVPSGKVVEVSVKVRVRAPMTIPFEGNIVVKVRNPGIKQEREGELWYSNDPESVRAPGPLFSAVLESRRPIRLLYHHVNDSTEALTIQVVVYNPSPTAAQVMITRGDGVPDTDPVRTGLEAAELFLKSWLNSSGEILTIPAQSCLPIALRRLPRNYTMSGLCSMDLLPGGPSNLLIRTEAQRPNLVEPTWRGPTEGLAPWAQATPIFVATPPTGISLSQHVYSNPFKDLSAGYRVGGKHTFVRIGQTPIGAVNTNHQLQGNFGVLYTVNATLENPTSTVSRVEIAFEASAGYSGGLFVVDGQMTPGAIIQSKEEFSLKVIRLAPGEKRLIKIMTMPLSGSSYPATLVLRPAGLGAPPVARLPVTTR